jgi:hypothetical protein
MDMKKIFSLILCFCICLTSFGWGATGHRATGHIAEKYLSKKARKELRKILGQENLAMVSTWMDEVRSDRAYDHTHDWHWVTIPDGMTYEQTEKNPNGDIIQTLGRLVAELKQGGLDAKTKAEHVKMIVHLVGDIHQPLHVGKEGDKGGNDVRVTWFRNNSNLHRVWDSDIINGTQLSYTELAHSLGKPDKETFEKWQKATVLDWANESISYRERIYNIGDGNLSYEYSYQNYDLVKLRILQAGIRMAAVLNDIFG